MAVLVKPYRDIILLDVHTGLGQAYQLHVMPGDAAGVADESLVKQLLHLEEDSDIYAYTPNSTPGFYSTHGDANNVMAELRRPDQRVLALTLEYGTIGESAVSKLQTLNRMILENEDFHYGHSTEAVGRKVKSQFAELFFPNDAKWRRNVLSRSRQLFDRLLKRMDPQGTSNSSSSQRGIR
jgi:hypothetical protein